ncbi:hypothetical protein FBU30_009539 [Linnemannia zychae]|nr:hypothetical protein FBU30_009539 [Linnemannia zychae]
MATPYFVPCPITPFSSRRISAYAELESPPHSPLRKSGFSVYSDAPSAPHDSKQQRRLNESRPIQIPLDLLSISNEPSAAARGRAKKRHTHRASAADSTFTLPQTRSLSQRFSLLFLRQSHYSTSNITIDQSVADCPPDNQDVGDDDKNDPVANNQICYQSATDSISTLPNAAKATALKPKSDLIHEIPITHEQTVCQASTQPIIAINSNSNSAGPNNSVRSVSSISSTSINSHHSSHGAYISDNLSNRLIQSTDYDTKSQEKSSDVSNSRKTLLLTMSTSVLQVKKQAVNILFSSHRHKDKKLKKKKHENETNEGQFATKYDSGYDENYTTSTLSLSSTSAPSDVLSSRPNASARAPTNIEIELINPDLSLPSPILSTSTGPFSDPAASGSSPSAWMMPITPAYTPSSCENSGVPPTSNRYFPKEYSPFMNSSQRNNRIPDVTDHLQCHPQNGTVSSSAAMDSRAQSFQLQQSLERNETQQTVKEKAPNQSNNMSYRKWILSKSGIISLMNKYKSGKKDKRKSVVTNEISSISSQHYPEQGNTVADNTQSSVSPSSPHKYMAHSSCSAESQPSSVPFQFAIDRRNRAQRFLFGPKSKSIFQRSTLSNDTFSTPAHYMLSTPEIIVSSS